MGCANVGCGRPDQQNIYFNAEQKFRSGDSDSALALVEPALHRSEKSDPAWHWRFRTLKAEILLRKRAREEAENLLRQDMSPGLPRDIAARRDIIWGLALCRLEKSSDSNRLFAEAADIVPQQDRILTAELQLNRGLCVFANELRKSSGDVGLAQPYFEAAAAAAHGADRYLEARAVGGVGFVLMRKRHFDEASEKFSAAVSITDSSWLRQSLLGDLGECYTELGDWKNAISNSEQAETLASQIKDAVEDRARWLVDLGREYHSQLQFDDAEKSWLRALGLAGARNTDVKARCLLNLAMLALERRDEQRAADYIKQGEELHLQGTLQDFLLVYKARLFEMQQDHGQAEALLKTVLGESQDPQVKYEAETDLASLYVAQRRFAEAEGMFRAGISTAEQIFKNIPSDRFRISFLDYMPFYDKYIRFLISQNRPVDALSVAERGRSRALAYGLNITESDVNFRIDLPQIQSVLKSTGQVVLAYWLGWETESYLWVITPSAIQLRKLPPEKEIDDAIDEYSEKVREIRTPQESGLGQMLYRTLVAPAEEYIPRHSKVIIVPHRKLYKLNFETLVSPHPKPHFWIEDVCIQNASFLAVLEQPRRAQPRYSKDLLLMGAPVEASKDFPGLVHAPEEIQKVGAHFPSAEETVLEGKDATPIAYQSSDPRQFRFFHFATHGTASDTNPLDSAIILSPSRGGYKLYARDIIKARIHPKLVTISTCYGAGTRQYSGEGLVGLAWAFMRAGAHQVVAALWEADDAANANLMDHFYAELTRGKTAAAALRDGKLAMLQSNGPRKGPYYWGSLQLYTGP